MIRRLLAASFLASTFAVAAAAAQERSWPSAPFRGIAPENPPCTCRAQGLEAEVGQDVCLSGRRARCVMVLNTTSWSVGSETCGAIASLGR